MVMTMVMIAVITVDMIAVMTMVRTMVVTMVMIVVMTMVMTVVMTMVMAMVMTITHLRMVMQLVGKCFGSNMTRDYGDHGHDDGPAGPNVKYRFPPTESERGRKVLNV